MNRLAVPAALLAIPLSRKRGFHAFLLPRFQVERVLLDLLDNVFLQNLALEALQRIFKAFAFVYLNFSQIVPRF